MRRSKFLLADDDDLANAWFMRTAVFVDLPNFYSRLIKSGIGEPRELRDYFLQWLDLDLLSKWLTGQTCPTWVFYSGRRIGPSSERIEGQHLEEFIKRTNRLPSVTAYDVNIPGDQREPFTTKCECGKTVTGLWESEKGVDASLIVHLFDTADSWDEAVLLSGDADFSPAVRSLRRRGKIVSGAGFANASESLVREFYRFEDLSESLLKFDFATFLVFGRDKLIDQWMIGKIRPEEILQKSAVGQVSCRWVGDAEESAQLYYLQGERIHVSEYFKVDFQTSNLIQPNSRYQLLDDYRKLLPELVHGRNMILINPMMWERVVRALPAILEKYHGTGGNEVGCIQRSVKWEGDQIVMKSLNG